MDNSNMKCEIPSIIVVNGIRYYRSQSEEYNDACIYYSFYINGNLGFLKQHLEKKFPNYQYFLSKASKDDFKYILLEVPKEDVNEDFYNKFLDRSLMRWFDGKIDDECSFHTIMNGDNPNDYR